MKKKKQLEANDIEFIYMSGQIDLLRMLRQKEWITEEQHKEIVESVVNNAFGIKEKK